MAQIYGFLSVIFIVIASFGLYHIIVMNQKQYTQTTVVLKKYMNWLNVYGACIDKPMISKDPFVSMNIKSFSEQGYAVVFDKNPLLQCQELTHLLNFDTYPATLEKINSLKPLIGEAQVIELSSERFTKIDRNKQFILVIGKQTTKDSEFVIVILGLENMGYSGSVLKTIFWFGWFSLIGICLISYYRKNVFNSHIFVTLSIMIEVLLMQLSYTSQSLLDFVSQIKLVALAFIVLICIKNQFNIFATGLIGVLSFVHLLFLDDTVFAPIRWVVLGVTVAIGLICLFIFGQNNEILFFSICSFTGLIGVVNPLLNISINQCLNPMSLTLVFGPAILEILQLRWDMRIFGRKTQDRLRSYEVSENDNFVKN